MCIAINPVFLIELQWTPFFVIMSEENWTFDSIGDVTGKVFVCTGANAGLGYHYTRHLYCRNGIVVMACRSTDKGEIAKNEIAAEFPNSKGVLYVLPLDLSSFDSVKAFVEQLPKTLGDQVKITVLCNNAGVMMLPERQVTADGNEMQIQTNHLSHFLLTGLTLQNGLLDSEQGRIVTISSLRHRDSKGIHFDDLNLSHKYDGQEAYFQSKLANLLFNLELTRRLAEAGSKIKSIAAHPGYAQTNLQGPMEEGTNPMMRFILKTAAKAFGQSAEMGAAPQLRASIDPNAQSGEYYGPVSLTQMGGAPGVVDCSKYAKDGEAAQRLWKLSEEICKFSFEVGSNLEEKKS
jgi:NAD(P)-dependent dehydrogenase (short-subunit alcohol dehydrogenase family)